MKQETLKKIVELADGFEHRNVEGNDLLLMPDGTDATIGWYESISSAWKPVYYPLLLRRAVEGWNDNHEVYKDIHLCAEHLVFTNKNVRHSIHFEHYQKTDYLTPQEQAIEACLIELLEV